MTSDGVSKNSVGFNLSSENWVVGVARRSGKLNHSQSVVDPFASASKNLVFNRS